MAEISDPSTEMTRWNDRIEALIRRRGGSLSASEFQEIVNVVYHDVEAGVYDEAHSEMWTSLFPMFGLLSKDIEQLIGNKGNAVLLDVGCGTGLATEFLLQSSLRKSIGQLILVDTSSKMIEKCKARSLKWNVPSSFICGQLDSLPDNSADLLVASSVLHHIRDLDDFCDQVSRIVRPGGVFFHIHDSYRNSSRSDQLAVRRSELKSKLRPSIGRRVARAISGRIVRLFRRNYLKEVNRRLISKGVIKHPLSANEIWSITDLRVGELPIAAADGLCLEELQQKLPRFERKSIRTYGFFGILSCHLPRELQEEEKRLIDAKSEEGLFLAAVWQKHK